MLFLKHLRWTDQMGRTNKILLLREENSCTCITEVEWKRWSRRMTLRSYLRLMFTCGNTKERDTPLLSKPDLFFFLGTLFSGHYELVIPLVMWAVALWSTHIKWPVIMKISSFNIKYHSYCRAQTEDRPFPFFFNKYKHVKYVEEA